ncbi:polysaccharide deacetylase family protein [Pimelobacter simplex]|uniref:polysaccharide deacetylase family protein n=1 Tax=Nocardioides simplex TaxID=2045 RepID=UPI003AAA562C
MSTPRVRVLMYHGVDRVSAARDPHGMFVTPRAFRDQVEHLLEAGYVPIDEATYLAASAGTGTGAGTPLPRRAVLLTFDDGYVGVGEHAAPVLASFGVPSVLYVPAGLVGGSSDWLPARHRHPLMGASELREVAADGMAIGAHGFDHADLTTLGAADLHRHVGAARTELERVVGRPVRSYAFPYGTHDARVRAAVRAAGYDGAFAVHDAAGPFATGRVDVNATDTLRSFRIKLHRHYPRARRATERFPLLRRAAHDLVGRAPREELSAPEATGGGR